MVVCKKLTAIALVLVRCACVGPNIDARPAVIVDPDEQSRKALQDAVSESLKDADVTLEESALTNSSSLVLEPRRLTSRESLKGESPSQERPEHFQLLIQGQACILVHEESGARHMLADTRCRPE